MDFINLLAGNPVVVGAVLVTALQQLHLWLVRIDSSGVLLKYSSQIHTVYLFLSFLTSVASLAYQGKLEDVDMNAIEGFIVYWAQVVLGGKAMDGKVTPKVGK